MSSSDRGCHIHKKTPFHVGVCALALAASIGVAQTDGYDGVGRAGGNYGVRHVLLISVDGVVTPNIGVTYSGSGKKQAEHGGFAHDDTNVMMLPANPRLSPATVTSAVETAQIAPTILKVLGLDPGKLDSVRQEGAQALPEVVAR